MKSTEFSLRFPIRILAGRLEQGTLTRVEAQALATLLRLLADGQSIEEIFNIKRSAHRPPNYKLQQRLYDLEVMKQPVKHGGMGLKLDDAIRKISEIHHISEETIKSDYKSDVGKSIRAEVKRTVFNPLELELDESRGDNLTLIPPRKLPK